MAESLGWSVSLKQLDRASEDYAIRFIEILLGESERSHASDIHLQPTKHGLEVRARIDGALHDVGVFESSSSVSPVARLKVLAGLLTYQTETPQEGRIELERAGAEMRVSTFPTLHGERAVVRLFPQSSERTRLADLGFDDTDLERLRGWLQMRGGALVICGPAGSGKTTTAYACLREILQQFNGRRCIVTLEDPIESAIPGIVQSQVNDKAGFDLHGGLRSLVRQDPEALMVGEIRDAFAAEVVVNASLTGHLVVTTFHAEDGASALSRLAEMEVEPYLLLSGVRAVITQRLVRRLCSCAEWSDIEKDRLGMPVSRWKRAVGCSQCQGTGYAGRRLLTEFLELASPALRAAVLQRRDRQALSQIAEESGARTLATHAETLVDAGETSAEEVHRVLGFFASEDGNHRSGL